VKLTVLGASGGFPAAGGATSGYLLEVAGHHILIDCGSGVLANLFRFISIEQLDAIILTHLHYDHISDMQVMKYAIDLSRKFGIERPAIPVVAPSTPETVAATLHSDGDLIVGQITAGSEMNIYGASVRFFAMEHPVETYGLRIELDGRVLAMTSDSTPCAAMQILLQQADLAVMDAGSIERLRKPKMMHMTAAECATLAMTCQVKRLVLTHLLPLIDPAEILAEATMQFSGAEIARPLVVYDI
jgi:ribonuclease BN (tRNA processing enzyme)